MKVVIFDMDGTLIDSQHDITASVNYVRQKVYGLSTLDSVFVVEAINRYQRNLPKLFYETELYEEDARALFEEHYHLQCIQTLRLYDGVLELLTQLKKEDVKLAVATNAPTPFALRMLSHLKVDHFFTYIVGADMVKTPKPDASMLVYSLERFGFDVTCDNAWMVGDNSKDMEAGVNAKIDSVFVTWGFASSGEGKHVISQPHELLELIS